MGAANGCTDVGGIVDTDTLDGITGNVTDGSYYVTPSASISGKLSPGDRIRIAGSHEVSGSLARQLMTSLHLKGWDTLDPPWSVAIVNNEACCGRGCIVEPTICP